MPADPYKYFRIEGRELVDGLGKGLLELEKAPGAPELIARLLRLAHTLKGAARVVKQKEIADHAHAIEEAIAPVRDGAVELTRDRVEAVLALVDAISARIAALSAPVEEGAAVEGPAPPDETAHALRADAQEMDGLLDGLTEVNVQLASLRRGVGALSELRHLAEILAVQLASPKAPASTARAAFAARGIAEELRDRVAGLERALATSIDQTDRELGQVRETAERLRLLPAGLLFTVLERTARDASATLEKRVAFEARGGDVRLDADVLRRVRAALVQAVRNAVAHGIEPESDRVAAGKPREGRVVVEVARRGSRVSFVCRDDGRGIDLAAIREVAVRRGALSRSAEAQDPQQIMRLLLRGGISTSDTVTAVSGRGIGLDVVRDVASRLEGDVDIQTQPGKGTTLELVVPVTLSSLEALVVEACGQTLAIPLDAVRRTLRVRSTDVIRTPRGDSIQLDGNVIPFAPLARSLRMRAADQPRRVWSAVVMESRGALAALGVDRLVGTNNVVLRPLPRLAEAHPSVVGASLDAEGNPQMILDSDGLVAAASQTDLAPAAMPKAKAPVLVIDDSLTTRMLEQSILESAGYEVELATSGEEAFEKARARRYALFLVDVEMPGMDGFTFVERSRADPLLRDTPAILVTSRDAPEDRSRGEAAGAAAYIVKSEFDQSELLERIGRLVG